MKTHIVIQVTAKKVWERANTRFRPTTTLGISQQLEGQTAPDLGGGPKGPWLPTKQDPPPRLCG